MKKIIVLFVLFICFGFSSTAKANCPNPMPEGLKICADFEESDNLDESIWSHYSAKGFTQDIAGKKDRFTLDSDSPFGGSFAVRSMDPNGRILNDYDTDSFFVSDFPNIFGRSTMTFGDVLFIKYAAKFPVDWVGEATDYILPGGPASSGGANHLRINGVTNRSIEATFGAGWLHGGSTYWYDSGKVMWGTNIYLKDNQWHEYAIEVKMPSSSSATDGALRMWRDDSGSYAVSDAKLNQEGIHQSEDFKRIAVVTPAYYKGPVMPMNGSTSEGRTTSGNWKFWLDDVQIWNRMPNEVVAPPPAACTETWSCTNWSAWSTCTNNFQNQTRACTDTKSCGTTNTKPIETQTQSCTSSQTVSTKLVINDRVKTTTTLNVRATPSFIGTYLGNEPTGSLGTVIGGPTYNGSDWWWQINYDNAIDGWSVERYLEKYITPVCVENWYCSGWTIWSTCANSSQSHNRICTDANSCKTTTTKPITTETQSCTVLVAETAAPVISSPTPTGTLTAGTTSATLSLTTDEPAICTYSITAGVSFASKTNTFSGAATTNHTATVSGLSSGSHTYYARCIDVLGNSNATDTLITFNIALPVVDTSVPTTPANLTATAISSSQINLTWTASTDNSGVSGYSIYRCTGSSCTPTSLITTTTSNSYSNTGLTANTTYTFRVSAYDTTSNTSDYSTVVSATTQTAVTLVNSGGGGGGGGGGSYTPPVTTPSTGGGTPTTFTAPRTSSTSLVPVTNTIATTNSSSLSETQIQAILTLIQSFGADQATLAKATIALRGTETASPSSSTTTSQPSTSGYSFTSNLYYGLENEQVKKLQETLAQDPSLYPEGLTSGYYGSLTTKAIQRFQCKHNIVCSGSAGGTGYGVFGPKTRKVFGEVYGD